MGANNENPTAELVRVLIIHLELPDTSVSILNHAEILNVSVAIIPEQMPLLSGIAMKSSVPSKYNNVPKSGSFAHALPLHPPSPGSVVPQLISP